MGLLRSNLTASRFRVVGATLEDGWRELYRDRLNEFAFKESPIPTKAATLGWCSVHDLSQLDFEDFNLWLYSDWILFALRTDKRKIPAKRFKAMLDRSCRAWCKDRDVERCPSSVRADIKEELEDEWIKSIIPSSSHIEIAWNISTGAIYIATHADSTCDEIRKRFFRTFGLRLIPHSPLDWIRDSSLVESLTNSPAIHFAADPSGVSDDD